ncbi:hypothetical protein Tco_1013105 [Tanacetum coccineum]
MSSAVITTVLPFFLVDVETLRDAVITTILLDSELQLFKLSSIKDWKFYGVSQQALIPLVESLNYGFIPLGCKFLSSISSGKSSTVETSSVAITLAVGTMISSRWCTTSGVGVWTTGSARRVVVAYSRLRKGKSLWRKQGPGNFSLMSIIQGAIMVVGASKPTVVAYKDGYFNVKCQMTQEDKLEEDDEAPIKSISRLSLMLLLWGFYARRMTRLLPNGLPMMQKMREQVDSLPIHAAAKCVVGNRKPVPYDPFFAAHVITFSFKVGGASSVWWLRAVGKE